MVPGPDVTGLLARAAGGEGRAVDELIPLVYDELRRLARSFAGSRVQRAMQPTALVHEAYLKLVGDDNVVDWQGRTHFFRIAARQMRRVVIDQVR